MNITYLILTFLYIYLIIFFKNRESYLDNFKKINDKNMFSNANKTLYLTIFIINDFFLLLNLLKVKFHMN